MLRLVSPNLSTRESFLPSARAAPKQQTNVADLLIAVCKVRHTVTCTVLAAPLLASGLTERFVGYQHSSTVLALGPWVLMVTPELVLAVVAVLLATGVDSLRSGRVHD